MKHWKYASYVIRHKWFVFVEAVRLGQPLLGIIHDSSKMLPDEWRPYTRFFYGSWRTTAEWAEKTSFDVNTYLSIGPRTQERVDAEFDLAWLKHIHRNKHHWQHWVLREDSGATKALEMPYRYICEMISDWRGAGKAQRHGDNTVEWYKANKDKMLLAEGTRETVERLLGLEESDGSE